MKSFQNKIARMLVGQRIEQIQLMKDPSKQHYPEKITTKWGQKCKVCEKKSSIKCDKCSIIYGKQIFLCATHVSRHFI